MAEDAPKRLNAEEVKAKVAECREMATRAKFPASCSNTLLERGSGSLARWRPSTSLSPQLAQSGHRADVGNVLLFDTKPT